MSVREKRFICTSCKAESYVDSDCCQKCKESNSIRPRPKQLYKGYLNGVLYGTGTLEEVHTLLTDYVLKHRMYGKAECSIRICQIEE